MFKNVDFFSVSADPVPRARKVYEAVFGIIQRESA